MDKKFGAAFVRICIVVLLCHVQQATSIQCYSCQKFNVTVISDTAGISGDMAPTFMANNLDFCGDEGDEFKLKLEGDNTTDASMYKKVCIPSTTVCTKTWGAVEFTYPFGDYAARFKIDYYLRGCDTLERLELGAPPATDDNADTSTSGVDPYKPKDKCYDEAYYQHSALGHQFFDYENVVFTNSTVCFCSGGSLCNTGALWKSSCGLVVMVAALVMVALRAG